MTRIARTKPGCTFDCSGASSERRKNPSWDPADKEFCRALTRRRYKEPTARHLNSRWQRIHALLDCKPDVRLVDDAAPGCVPKCPRCQKPMRLLGTLARSPP